MSRDARVGYRLVKTKWAQSAFDGEGAKRYGGRWNSRGKRCVYLASSESLAILEVLVHLEDYRQLVHYSLYRLDLSQVSAMRLSEHSLPGNWRADPAPADTALIGDEWLATNSSLTLEVPSAIVPRELNFLLNCEHPGYQLLVQKATQLEFAPDPRLLR